MAGHGGRRSTLANSDFVLMWGGTELDPSETSTVGIGIRHTLKIISSGDAGFKGFLLRLSGKNGENASTTLVARDSFAKVNDLCDADVIGITHVNANKKSSVEVTLNHPREAELFLEVTVVTTKYLWAYDSFDISVSGNSSANTFEPTAFPTSDFEDPPNTSDSSICRASSVLVLGVFCWGFLALL